MRHKTQAFIIAVFLAGLMALTACLPENPDSLEVRPNTWLPLEQQLSCLSGNGVMIAAHRGTSRETPWPENSRSGLDGLIAAGIIMAEIDVARIAGGTHILFHDGLWDDKSTGKGPIVKTPWSAAQSILLRDTKDRITSDTPIKLDDYLLAAQNRLYLEIDFKSSADYKTVIKSIRRAKMQDNVILISYNARQARKLAALAPEMMISIPVKQIGDIRALMAQGLKKNQIAAWVKPSNSSLITALNQKTIPVLIKAPNPIPRKSGAIIAVSDYALHNKGIIFDNKPAQRRYSDCIGNGAKK